MTAKVLHIDRQAIKIAVGDFTEAKTTSTGVGKMNLYEVNVNQFSVKVQASSAQVALKKGMVQLDHLNYMQFLGMKSLQGGETSTLNVAIHNVGKMIEIQRGNNIWADRKYVLATEWFSPEIFERDGWKVCKDVKNAVMDRANEIREILKVLHKLGDSMVWDGCWIAPHQELVDEWEPRLEEMFMCQINETTMATINQVLLGEVTVNQIIKEGKA